MIRNYFNTALRNILANKVGTAITIFCLSLGISCCLVAYLMLQNELSFDYMHTNSDNIYRVTLETDESWGKSFNGNTPYPLPEALRNQLTVGENTDVKAVLQVHGPSNGIISIPTEEGTLSKFEQADILFADESYLSMFNFGNAEDLWVEGYHPEALSEPNQVLLSEKAAKKFFGNTSALGKTLRYNKTHKLTVAGVLKNSPRNTSLPYSVIISFKTFAESVNPYVMTQWGMTWAGSAFVELNEFGSIDYVNEVLNKFPAAVLPPEEAEKMTVSLQPLRKVHTDSRYGDGHYYTVPLEILWGLPILGLICLLIACVNFVNLSTAQAVKRSKEVGIRKVLGGNRKQLVFQFLGETAFITLISIAFALWFGELMLQQLNNMLSIIEYNLTLNSSVVLFALGTLVLVTLVAGFYPSLVLSGYKPIEALQNKINTKKSEGKMPLRKTLVITQFVFAQIMLVMVIIVATQMNHFKNTEWGFIKEGVVNVSFPGSEWQDKQNFREQVLQQRDVEEVSLALAPPITSSNHWGSTFYIKGENSDDNIHNNLKHIDERYIEMFEIPLIAGRNLTEQAEGDSIFELVVNETLVKKAGFENPQDILGIELSFNGSYEGIVVGVTSDFHNRTLQESIEPSIFFYNKGGFSTACIKINTADVSEKIKEIERAFNESFPEDYFSYTFVDDEINNLYIVEDLIFKGLGFFALIAILIGCLGLYGLVAYTTTQKSKEIGIRKVMGASVGNILLMFSGEFGKLILIAFAIAAPVTWFLADSWLQDFYYRIPLHVGYFAVGIGLSLAIALVTVGYRSYRSAVANPVKSLRDE